MKLILKKKKQKYNDVTFLQALLSSISMVMMILMTTIYDTRTFTRIHIYRYID